MEYARQLYLYSVWIKKKYGKFPKYLWFFQFRIGHIEKLEFNIEDFYEVLHWIYDTLCQIEEEQFWMPIDFSNMKKDEIDNATFFCRNLCDYRMDCSYWKNAIKEAGIKMVEEK